MQKRRVLTLSDHVFLALETKKQPMHVAGVCVFELPEGADDGFLYQLIDDMKMNDTPPTFPFNQVLDKGLFWKTEDNFKVEHHFRHIALPRPSGMKELMAYISREHSRVMDRQKPLWEFHLIEGLAPESEGRPMRFALYLKIHHAMVDGVAAMRLLQMSLSRTKDAAPSLPFWALPTGARNHLQSLIAQDKSFMHLAKNQVTSIFPVGKGLIQRYIDRHLVSFTSVFDAPSTILNQKIRATRKVLARSFSKSDFSNIACAFGTSTNDVILAVCSGALRRYLIQHNALPDEPLIAFVPVSLRKDDSALGNQLSFLLANLATNQPNIKERLLTIKDSMADGKARFANMNQTQIINYSVAIYAAAGLNLATGLKPSKQAFNLIISNVPGAKDNLYLHGARLTGIFPASVLFDGQALNITLANYHDKIDFGITACDFALPNIECLLDFMDNELRLLQACI